MNQKTTQALAATLESWVNRQAVLWLVNITNTNGFNILLEIVHLYAGDYVELKTDIIDGRISHLNFCISLSQFFI